MILYILVWQNLVQQLFRNGGSNQMSISFKWQISEISFWLLSPHWNTVWWFMSE